MRILHAGPHMFWRGLLWGIALALPFWVVLCLLVVLALPPRSTTVPLGDPAGIPLNGNPP